MFIVDAASLAWIDERCCLLTNFIMKAVFYFIIIIFWVQRRRVEMENRKESFCILFFNRDKIGRPKKLLVSSIG